MYTDSNNGKIVAINKETIINLARNTEGLEDILVGEKSVTFRDTMDDHREMKITFPEHINLEEIFEFNSLELDKEAFFDLFNTYVKKEQMICIKKVCFINNQDELDRLVAEYPEQSFCMRKTVGIHWYMDNIILVNVEELKRLAEEMNDEIFSAEEEFALGIWGTLIHEIRHAECSNLIIPAEFISDDDASEYGVEDYCRKTTDLLMSCDNYTCFKY